MDKGEASIKRLNRISISLTTVAPLFFLVGALFKIWIGLEAAYYMNIIAVMLYGGVAGIGIAELIGLLARERLHWRSHHIQLIYLVAFAGFYFAPGQYGAIRAELDRSPKTSTLEIVQIDQAAQKEDWRLVTAFGDQTLLMRIAGKKEDRAFKIISTKEIRMKHEDRFQSIFSQLVSPHHNHTDFYSLRK